MIRQIMKLSPHQNGKVFGVLTAVATLPMFLCTMVPMLFMIPQVDQAGNPVNFAFPMGFFMIMPVFYLVFTYLFVAFGCWLYNRFFRFIGGFEFEFDDENQVAE